MLMLRFQEFIKKLLQAFGIVKINDGSKHYSFNKPWYRSSDYFRYVWRRSPGEQREQAIPEELCVQPENVKEEGYHIIKQP